MKGPCALETIFFIKYIHISNIFCIFAIADRIAEAPVWG